MPYHKFILFLGIWITGSFVFHYSTFLLEIVPDYVRIPLAGVVLISGWHLARGGMKEIFGTERSTPGVIRTGVFGIVRHPIYTGAILFYLGAILITLSIASAAFWIVVIVFYILIAGYEEKNHILNLTYFPIQLVTFQFSTGCKVAFSL